MLPHGGSLLRGVRVLDLSRVLAGPFAGMMLGDMGADVWKLERPRLGDDTRSWGPPFVGPAHAEMATYFACVNRNKRSLAIDLKAPQGQRVARALAAKADVVIENFLPGKLDELGLGYETLRKENPGVILCSITGYGQVGPSASRAGYDVNVSAESGLMSITGPKDGAPVKVGVAMTDVMTGMQATTAILGTLFERQRTGVGRHLDASLMDTQLLSLVNIASSTLNAGWTAKRWGTEHESIVPYAAFAVQDGELVVSATTDTQFAALCGILGGDAVAWPLDPRFASNRLRVKHRDELYPRLRAAFLAVDRTRQEWLQRLQDAGIAAAPVQSVKEALESDHARGRGAVRTVTHPEVGAIRVVAPAVKYSPPGVPWSATAAASDPVGVEAQAAAVGIARPPPLLGEHTLEVLRENGLMTEDREAEEALRSGWLQQRGWVAK